MGRPGLPTGTVTFLFTDVEGSTRLLRVWAEGRALAFEDAVDLALAARDGAESPPDVRQL